MQGISVGFPDLWKESESDYRCLLNQKLDPQAVFDVCKWTFQEKTERWEYFACLLCTEPWGDRCSECPCPLITVCLLQSVDLEYWLSGLDVLEARCQGE